jgi:hypothetical protein
MPVVPPDQFMKACGFELALGFEALRPILSAGPSPNWLKVKNPKQRR